MRRKRTISGVALIALTLTLFALTTPAANAAPTTDTPESLDRARGGKDAAANLGGEAAAIAARNGMTEGELRQRLANDESLWIDESGQAFYVEESVGAEHAPAPGDPSPEPGPFPYSETFLLHSRPGATKVIYLDFNGETIANSGWNNNSSWGTTTPASFFAEAFDLDGNPGSFSNAEQDMIQSVWQRVAEDYSMFDVDVTTQDPGLAAIDRTDANDQNYGTRALITNTTTIQSGCSCGGIAYLGVFDLFSATAINHQYYQPALIFQRGLAGINTDAKYLGEATSHEVGHNVGLNHDGTATVGYYPGHGGWAPIMGRSYDLPITHWSKGEYSGANNAEDDFVTMQANGLSYRADDHGNATGTATALTAGNVPVNGIITTATDVDFFTLNSTGGAITVSATPAAASPNLDIRLDLYNSAGTLVATNDPAAVPVSFDTASGMGASLTIPSAGTWYVRVDGVGVGNPLNTGYSDYSSVGQYTLSVTGLPTAEGLLRVATNPAVPSQIVVDGQPNDTWGLTWMKITPGSHQVCFRDVPGFATPSCENVTVTAGNTTTVTGTFTRLGTLRVITSPAVASTISVDGTPRNDWGVWTDLSAGSHEVCFGAVAGFDAPACQTVNVTAANTTTVTGTFTSNPAAVGPTGHGTLRVTTSPALPSQVIVDGIVRDTWGAWFKIAPGSHQVCFTGLEGYSTPACQNVTVTAGATTNVNGAFTQRGFLRVLTSPAVAGTITVNGVPRNDWGMWTDLPTGAVQVCFGPVPGRVTPACQNSTVTAGATTTITGTYT